MGAGSADEGVAERDDDASGYVVEDFEEGDEEGVDAGEQAEVTSELAGAETEVSCGEEKEGDPEEQEDAPDGLAGAEGDGSRVEG